MMETAGVNELTFIVLRYLCNSTKGGESMKKKLLVLISVFAILLSSSTVAFAATVREFDEAKFAGMTVTYSDTGAPIVNDPDAIVDNLEAEGVVTAVTMEDTWLYRDKRLNTGIFIIPAGRAVVVHQTDTNYGAAQVTYAGYTGWVYTSKLRLGE